VEHQAVAHLERALCQVLVRAVDRVARLERDDPLPAAARELGARLRRSEAVLGEAGVDVGGDARFVIATGDNSDFSEFSIFATGGLKF